MYALSVFLQVSIIIIPLISSTFPGELVHHGLLGNSTNIDEICDIALSGWRLFALDIHNAIHVYDVKENKLLTTFAPQDLGLLRDFVIQKIWCSCVGLLHVLYMDWDSYKLRCFQINKDNAIWPF